jgi:membrane-bound lytic murein transglycosylase B
VKISALALLLLAPCAAAIAEPAVPYPVRPEVKAFVSDLVRRHGFAERELDRLFAHAKRQEAVLTAMQLRPAGVRSWADYRAAFVNQERLQGGLKFWNRHRATLARARARFGVPEEVIVAILGIETFYGRRTGHWRVIDSLATLAFDYPPRAGYFRAELENFLLFARDRRLNVLSVRGSYAGAIGIPQFMPGTYRRYAVDFDGDGECDLREAADAIGSVANFLKEHGWRRGEAALLDAQVSGADFAAYADGGLRPRYSLDELEKAGVRTRGIAPADERALLVELQTPGVPSEFRVGFHNFWVITRYNHSAFYASAVIDLARRLRDAQPL